LFVGGAHISRNVILPNSLIHLLDRRFPGKTLVISAIQVPMVSAEIAKAILSWPVPSAAEIRNTWLGWADVREVGFQLSTGRLQDDIDVVLLLNKTAFSNIPAAIDPNSALAIELRRRQRLQKATLPFRGGEIRFDYSSTSITRTSTEALDSVITELRRDGNLLVLVKAHADSTEPQADELSTRRAELIVEWLVRRGIDRRRIAALGCGPSRPLWHSDTEPHRAANRRAEIVRQSRGAACQPPASFDRQ
jgi:outer membrane protein OmpA-like peptidoglycan-associated protein